MPTADVIDKPDVASAEGASQEPSAGQQAPSPFDWRTEIPREIRDETTQKKIFKDVPDLKTLFKNYYEAQTYMGNAVKIPKEDAPFEEWDKFYGKLRPGTPEGYKVNRPSNGEWDDKTEKKFLMQAHTMGLTNKQVQGIFDWLGTFTDEALREGGIRLEKTTEELQKEWGSNYARNVAYAQRTVQQVGGDEIKQLLDDTGLGNHPAFVRFFAKIGKELAEDGIIPGGIMGIPGREEALQKIAELKNDRKGPYWDVNHPDHITTIQKVEELYKLVYD